MFEAVRASAIDIHDTWHGYKESCPPTFLLSPQRADRLPRDDSRSVAFQRAASLVLVQITHCFLNAEENERSNLSRNQAEIFFFVLFLFLLFAVVVVHFKWKNKWSS